MAERRLRLDRGVVRLYLLLRLGLDLLELLGEAGDLFLVGFFDIEEFLPEAVPLLADDFDYF